MVEKRVPDCLGLKVSVHFLSTFDTPPLPMSHPTSLGAAHGRDHVRVCDNSGDRCREFHVQALDVHETRVEGTGW